MACSSRLLRRKVQKTPINGLEPAFYCFSHAGCRLKIGLYLEPLVLRRRFVGRHLHLVGLLCQPARLANIRRFFDSISLTTLSRFLIV